MPRRHTAPGKTLALIGAALSLAAGCAQSPPDLEQTVDPGISYEFAPAALRISPLTRLEPGLDGDPELAVYFELVDRWGHATKAPGVVRISLYRVEGLTGGLADREEVWVADLTEPDQNSRMYDITGMYRVPLAELPEWLERQTTAEDERIRARIRVLMNTIGRKGQTVSLRDVFERDF